MSDSVGTDIYNVLFLSLQPPQQTEEWGRRCRDVISTLGEQLFQFLCIYVLRLFGLVLVKYTIVILNE